MTTTLTFNDGAGEPTVLDWIRAQAQTLEPEAQAKVATFLSGISIGLVGLGAAKLLHLGEVLTLVLATALGVFLQPQVVDLAFHLLF